MVSIDWQITSKCNRNCNFCFGPKNTNNELNTKEAIKLIGIFENLGIKVVGITGGEPLLRDDIAMILKELYERGIYIYLSTNCDFYKKYRKEILKYVSIIGIPVESRNEEIHDRLRGKGNFEKINFAIDDISQYNEMIFNVGTIISNKNYLNLKEIEYFLSKYKDNIGYWKLYEMIQYNRIKDNNDIIYMDFNEHKYIFNYLGEFLDSDKIVLYTLDKRNRSYLLIKPNGDVFVPILDKNNPKEFVVGNFLKNPLEEIINNWNREVSYKDYMKDYRIVINKYNNL